MKALTDREYWRNYWKGRAGAQPAEHSHSHSHSHSHYNDEYVFFADLLGRFPRGEKTFIEIGGYPGRFAAYFKKTLGYETSLLDFVDDTDGVREVERQWGLPSGSIHCISGDFLKIEPPKKFDVVFSAGFAEHFSEPDAVIARHLEFLVPGGTLFVSVPNLRGAEGWLQKNFDPESFSRHHREIMDPERLRKIAEDLRLKEIEIFYHGLPHLWLDYSERHGRLTRWLVRVMSALMSRIFRNSRGRWISPFVVLIARG